MFFKKLAFLFFALFLMNAGLAARANASALLSTKAQILKDTKEPKKYDSETERLLKQLTLGEKIGQLFIIGFKGETVDDEGLKATLEKIKPGGVIVYKRNIRTAKQVSELTYQAQRVAVSQTGVPLLIAVDQEGGNVVRIKTAAPLPSALALGTTQDENLVKEAGYHTGVLLKALGLNMNLAPVLDVSDPDQRSFIGTRTFGEDPKVVSLMGGSFAHGLKEAGVLPTGKHFPGHGAVWQDSHLQTPQLNKSLPDLMKFDLVPFAKLSNELANSAIMVAHISYPLIDSSNLPATFSKVIISDILRKKMDFEGLVITDDLQMAGAHAFEEVTERAVRSIEAGVDMIMVGWNRKLQSQLVTSIEKAVATGRLSEERVNESVRRILRVKKQYASFEPPKRPDPQQLVAALTSPSLRHISDATLRSKFEKAVASFNKDSLDTVSPRPLFVFSTSAHFYNMFKSRLKGRSTRFYQITSQNKLDVDRIMRSNPLAYGIFYISGNSAAKTLNQVAADSAARIIVVNAETQALLKNPALFKHVIDVHFRHPLAGQMTATYLFGKALVRKPTSSR